MTGFGAARAQVGTEEISVELKAVNHKFCEVKARLPRELSVLEPQLVKRVKDRLARGAVEVMVRRQSASMSGTAPVLDVTLAREYQRVFQELAHALGTSESVSIDLVAQQPGVVRVEERGVNLEDAQKATESALGEALDALLAMRETEGATIAQDLSNRAKVIENGVHALEKLAPAAVAEYQKRLSDRIAELAKDVTVDPARLVQEVALFAERTDVAEEMTRLKSHLDQFRALLESPEPSGRRLDFLVQEMHREVNTTGSKSQHQEISAQVVALKAEVERIREQVQNLE